MSAKERVIDQIKKMEKKQE